MLESPTLIPILSLGKVFSKPLTNLFLLIIIIIIFSFHEKYLISSFKHSKFQSATDSEGGIIKCDVSLLSFLSLG